MEHQRNTGQVDPLVSRFVNYTLFTPGVFVCATA